jgi:hypothetical protein
MRLAVDGEIYSDPAVISTKIIEFYQKLFTEVGVRRPLLDDLPFSTIADGDVLGLDGCFTEDEVLGAITSMCVDQAPCSDGFLMAFFQSCWSILKGELMQTLCRYSTIFMPMVLLRKA